jgi:biotin/methionine sulfoxide reductase
MQRIPHCAHWGAFDALVEDGRIVGIEPHPGDPVPSHMLASIPDMLDPSVRISQPMVRKGWLEKRGASDRRARGHEPLVPVSWDVALDLAAAEIDRVRRLHGNESIFAGSYGWTSAGRFHHAQSQVKRFFNCVGGYTGHVDTYSVGAGAVIARHVIGPDGYAQPNSMEHVAEHTDLLLVFGALTPRTEQVETGGMARHGLTGHLARLKQRGARIIHISPRRDDMPAGSAAEWWPIAPNTDTALLIGLAGEIVLSGRHDQAFLARCCSGSDEFLAYLTGAADGQPKTAEWAADITGLDAADIRRLAAGMTTKSAFITISWSLQRAVHGEQPWWAGLGLASVAGQIGRLGGGVGYGFASTGGAGHSFPLGSVASLSHGKKPNKSFIPVARISDMLLKPGETFTYEGERYTYPDIRLVFWAGGNPFHHHQDLGRLADAWAVPETIIVQEPVWTATARRADIVLPATSSLERNDVSGGRRADAIFVMKKVVEPVGDARSDFEIMRGLAARLGVEAAFTEGRDEMGWLRHLYEETRASVGAKGGEMPPFETFWEAGHAIVPQKPHGAHLSRFREDPERHPLGTESGRIVLYSRKLEACAYPDCPPHPKWIEPPEWLGAAGRRTYPFHLITAQPNGRLHSQLDFGRTSQAEKHAGREAVLLNPEDAKRLGLKDGATALLHNARGRCLAGVRLSADVRRGVAVLPTGAWHQTIESADGPLDIAGNPNVLTLDVPASAFSGGCAAHTCLVAIERYEGNAPLPSFAPPEMASS